MGAMERCLAEDLENAIAEKRYFYKNLDGECECWKCEKEYSCIHANAFRRHRKEIGGLGLCPKLKKAGK